MKMYQTLVTGALIACIGLSGCKERPTVLVGEVRGEFGSAHRIVEYERRYIDMSSELDNINYGIVIGTNYGNYVIKIRESYGTPLLALARAVEPRDNIAILLSTQTKINDNYLIGITSSDNIDLSEKKLNP